MKRFLLCALAITFILFYGCESNGGADKGKEKTTDSITEDTTQVTSNRKPNVNVYVENSASIDGYVNGGNTEFKNIIYSYLSDISRITDSLNLFYINSKLIPLYNTEDMSNTDKVKKFSEDLCKDKFIKMGGKRGDTKISQIIDSVLRRTGSDDISILITDGIISLGNETEEYLEKQQIDIKNAMKAHLDANPTTVVLYMMCSKFKGTFYDKNNKKIQYSGEDPLPFYIWMFGNSKDIAYLKEQVGEPGYKESKAIKKFEISEQGDDLNYRIKRVQQTNKKATYEEMGTHEVAVKERDVYRFQVQVDYSGFLYDDEYLLETSNYRTDDTAAVVAKSEKLDSNDEYSHSLTIDLKKDFFPKGCKEKDLKIWFDKKSDDWSDVNDDEGNTAVPGKTYGIKYQVGGICDAYKRNSKDGKCAEMIIKVKKSK